MKISPSAPVGMPVVFVTLTPFTVQVTELAVGNEMDAVVIEVPGATPIDCTWDVEPFPV